MAVNNQMEEHIKDIITGIADMASKQHMDNNAERLISYRERFNQNEGLYDAEMELEVLGDAELRALPFIEKHNITNPRLKSIAVELYSQILPHFIRTFIEKNEGSTCSGDKEAFIIRSLKKYCITGKVQSLYVVYDDNPDKQTYWSPTSWKDTNEVLDAFYRWYKLE